MNFVIVALCLSCCLFAIAQECPRDSAGPSEYCVCNPDTGVYDLADDPNRLTGCQCGDFGDLFCPCVDREPVSPNNCFCDPDTLKFFSEDPNCPCDSFGETHCPCEVSPIDAENCECTFDEVSGAHSFTPTAANSECCDFEGSKMECAPSSSPPSPCGREPESPEHCVCVAGTVSTTFVNIHADANCECDAETGFCAPISPSPSPCGGAQAEAPDYCQCNATTNQFVAIAGTTANCECDVETGACVSPTPCDGATPQSEECVCEDGVFVNALPNGDCVCNRTTGFCDPCGALVAESPDQCGCDGGVFYTITDGLDCECDPETGFCAPLPTPTSQPTPPTPTPCGTEAESPEFCVCDRDTNLFVAIAGTTAECECDADTGLCVFAPTPTASPCTREPESPDYCVCNPDTNTFMNLSSNDICDCDRETGACEGPCVGLVAESPNRCSCIDGVFRNINPDEVCVCDETNGSCVGPCDDLVAESPNRCTCIDGVFRNINSDEACLCDENTGSCVGPCDGLVAESPEECRCIDGIFVNIASDANCVCVEDTGACASPNPCEREAVDPEFCVCDGGLFYNNDIPATRVCTCDIETGECVNVDIPCGRKAESPNHCFCIDDVFQAADDTAPNCYCTDIGQYKCDEDPCRDVAPASPDYCKCVVASDGTFSFSPLNDRCSCDADGRAVGPNGEDCDEPTPCDTMQAVSPDFCRCVAGAFEPIPNSDPTQVEICCDEEGGRKECEPDLCEIVTLRQNCKCSDNGVYSVNSVEGCECRIFPTSTGLLVAEEFCPTLCDDFDIRNGCACDPNTGEIVAERPDCDCTPDGQIYCPPPTVPIGCEESNAPTTVTNFVEECDCRIIGIDEDGVQKGELVCDPRPTGCDIATRPNEFCWCEAVGITATGEEKFAWFCGGNTCEGQRPENADCWCELMPGTDAFDNYQYVCPDACDPTTRPECARPQCISDAAGNPVWECFFNECAEPRPEDYPQECAIHDTEWYCHNGQVKFRCHSNPCNCDDAPLPEIDNDCDGIIEYYCEIDGEVVDGQVISADVVDSQCARRVAVCIPVGNPPPVECGVVTHCGFPQCVNLGINSNRCDLTTDGAPVRDFEFSCEDECLYHSVCERRQTNSGAGSCGFTKSADYEFCLRRCHTPTTPPPPEDKCSFINDACACSEIPECAVCSNSVKFQDDSGAISSQVIHRCVSANSDAVCRLNGNVFSDRAEGIDNDCDRIVLDEPVVPGTDPKPDEVIRCLSDDRCNNSKDINQRIRDLVNEITRRFTIVILLVVDANVEQGSVSLHISTFGEGVPAVTDHEAICEVVKAAVAGSLDFDIDIVSNCQLRQIVDDTAAPQKRQGSAGQSTEYFADMTMDSQNSAAASTSAMSAVVILAASVLALLF